jgi:hypothetical protein
VFTSSLYFAVSAYQKNFDDNTPHFDSVKGHANVTYITFATPTVNGLGYLYPLNFMDEIADARDQGMDTLISVGGWGYRNMFSFFPTTDLTAWAQKVKTQLDSFGAVGIDFDYEAETHAQWHAELVESNVLSILRTVLPRDQYIISLTVSASSILNTEAQALSLGMEKFNGTIPEGSMFNMSASVLTQFGDELDLLQLMSYDDGPKFDTTMAMGYAQTNYPELVHKMVMGIELGSQYGRCNAGKPPVHITSGWCTQGKAKVDLVATQVKQQGFRGVFFWSNVDDASAQTLYDDALDILQA